MFKKKRVFICIHYMEIGGAERSLLGLLNAFDLSRFDVDLFVYQHTGEFMSLIPKNINLLPEIKKYSTIERPMIDVLKEGFVDIVIARLIAKYKYQRYISKNKLIDHSSSFQFIANATTPLLPSLNKLGEYDLAISFVTPHNIIRDKVLAKKKIAWIHTDYSNVQINKKLELPVWNSYDNIISISESVSKTFLKVFPSLEDKIVLIENILSPNFVREQAESENVESEMPNEEGVIKLCSVGRFTRAKNFDNVPSICNKIIRAGLNVRWYIIGFGGDLNLIKQNIVKEGMQEHVILLGKKNNPYPFMKACDIYVQPSRYEGKAVTVREAQMLYKPVVITNFPTAKSQLTDGVDGIIVPIDNDSVARELKSFIKNKDMQIRLITNLHSTDYGNEIEVNKIYNIV
ncbi:glycosyltransferase [Ancylomarina sp. 16SWW S1-10-2]|uniref:glycosyltransferase n=1 Tax=Ancylomarina sp. 16SWW S1-10-2 TaxID=2499681 RepID=UPI0012AE31A0|nr:glycosyltransferase [Ancylomarina sp. 16SWW S1-10-2]MRT93431.1 glycosyltransferase [Ancylomarina sp. 16SWW S1-10-2]